MGMTNEKVLDAVARLEDLVRQSYPATTKERADEEGFAPMPSKRAAHAVHMGAQIRLFLVEGRREKAMRWLGFLQGLLWADGYVSLGDLMRMNMPNEEAGEAPDAG